MNRPSLVEQVGTAAGGPCCYTGGDTKKTQAGLGITEEDGQVSAKQLAATLDPFNALEKEKNEGQAFVTGLKKDIVEK